MSPQTGMVIAGKYRLQHMIGQGGMGCVFAAENMLTGKRVAIKCMQAELASHPETSVRFLREARASAKIRHPNVVDVYDVVMESGTAYLVMELLEGEPLSAMMQRDTTPLPELIRLLLSAMRGASAAHRMGVIHRDIKPDNIFLAHEGDDASVVPKVLDFGISKVRDAHDPAITAPGAAIGTALYMPIEQLNGAPDVDARVDVYAFGVILYQAVTGRPPFDADSFPVLVARIMTENPTPAKQWRADLPTALSKLIDWAMAKRREDRIASLDAFISELEPFAHEITFKNEMTNAPRETPRISTPSSPASPPPRRHENIERIAEAAASATLPTPYSTPMRAGAAYVPSAPPRSRSIVVLGLLALGCAGWWWSRSELGAPTPASQPPQQPVVSPPPRPLAAAPPAVDAAPARPLNVPVPMALPTPALSKPNATPASPVERRCKPNYFFDTQGEMHFKPECFRPRNKGLR